MSQTVKVVIMRHGDKKKNRAGVELLTAKGHLQIQSTVDCLQQMINFDSIVYSGEPRTLQCATIAQQLLRCPDTLEICPGIHFAEVGDKLGITEDSFAKEFNAVMAVGNTIAAGIEKSEFARELRKQLIPTIVELAKYGNVLGFSHSPLASLAAPKLSFPYHIESADAIIYEISGDKIISANHFPCLLE